LRIKQSKTSLELYKWQHNCSKQYPKHSKLTVTCAGIYDHIKHSRLRLLYQSTQTSEGQL